MGCLKPGRIDANWLNKAWIDAADPADPALGDRRFRLEVWTTTLARIRKIEAMMAGKQR